CSLHIGADRPGTAAQTTVELKSAPHAACERATNLLRFRRDRSANSSAVREAVMAKTIVAMLAVGALDWRRALRAIEHAALEDGEFADKGVRARVSANAYDIVACFVRCAHAELGAAFAT